MADHVCPGFERHNSEPEPARTQLSTAFERAHSHSTSGDDADDPICISSDAELEMGDRDTCDESGSRDIEMDTFDHARVVKPEEPLSDDAREGPTTGTLGCSSQEPICILSDVESDFSDSDDGTQDAIEGCSQNDGNIETEASESPNGRRANRSCPSQVDGNMGSSEALHPNTETTYKADKCQGTESAGSQPTLSERDRTSTVDSFQKWLADRGQKQTKQHSGSLNKHTDTSTTLFDHKETSVAGSPVRKPSRPLTAEEQVENIDRTRQSSPTPSLLPHARRSHRYRRKQLPRPENDGDSDSEPICNARPLKRRPNDKNECISDCGDEEYTPGSDDEDGGDEFDDKVDNSDVRKRRRTAPPGDSNRGRLGIRLDQQKPPRLMLSPPPSNGPSDEDGRSPHAKFEEWPLQNVALKRIMLDGVATFQIQFGWDPRASHHTPHHVLSCLREPTTCKSAQAAQRSATRIAFTREEDTLLRELKEGGEKLAWPEIHRQFSEKFPNARSQGSLQVHYSTKLKGV